MRILWALSKLFVLFLCTVVPETNSFLCCKTTTIDRISAHNYPVEEHTVRTSDGYILTLFRIPFSPKRNNEDLQTPVIYLQHGLLSSSDCWILNGPDNALAYLLVDAGYDVWMGNARGNTYSRKHATKSPWFRSFWNFEWNEIGVYDLPATIDYILDETDQDSLHYVGHGQGTTAFMVLLSSIPAYNNKIKTSHMLAPAGFMDHITSPLAKMGGPLFGNPSFLSTLISSKEFMPSNKLLSMLAAKACRKRCKFQSLCENILFLLCGWDSEHFNRTLLPDVMNSHPAGASTSQFIHYIQEYESGHFRKFDLGRWKNKRHYKQKTPPPYVIENIHPQTPLHFYYSDNDYLASVYDVERLAKILDDNVELHHVEFSDWNHLDFLWAMEVKEIINDRVIKIANEYEEEYGSFKLKK